MGHIGKPIAPLGAESSIVVQSDDLLGASNHAVELEICMRWFSSYAGPVPEAQNPAGYANIHAVFHRNYVLKQQAQVQQNAVPPWQGVAPPS